MFGLTFALGFGLLVVAVYFGVQGREVLSIAFGTLGARSIIGILVSDPPLKIQDSRGNYAQLTIGVLAWFSDLVDKSAILQQNQAFHNLLLGQATNVDTAIRRK